MFGRGSSQNLSFSRRLVKLDRPSTSGSQFTRTLIHPQERELEAGFVLSGVTRTFVECGLVREEGRARTATPSRPAILPLLTCRCGGVAEEVGELGAGSVESGFDCLNTDALVGGDVGVGEIAEFTQHHGFSEVLG